MALPGIALLGGVPEEGSCCAHLYSFSITGRPERPPDVVQSSSLTVYCMQGHQISLRSATVHIDNRCLGIKAENQGWACCLAAH